MPNGSKQMDSGDTLASLRSLTLPARQVVRSTPIAAACYMVSETARIACTPCGGLRYQPIRPNYTRARRPCKHPLTHLAMHHNTTVITVVTTKSVRPMLIALRVVCVPS